MDENNNEIKKEEVKNVEESTVQVERTPEPEKKASGALPVILIIIVIAVIGGGVFLAYNNGLFEKKDKNDNNVVDKDDDNNEKEPEKKKFEEETLTKDSAIVQKLYKIFSEPESHGQYKEATEAYKKRVTLNLLEESDMTKKTCGDLDESYYSDDDNGFWLCSVKYDIGNEGSYNFKDINNLNKIKEQIKGEEISTISVDLFHEKYNTIFEGTFEDKSEYLGECMRFLYYDKVNNLYAVGFLVPFAGCIATPYENVLKGIVQENGMLTIQTEFTVASEPKKLIDYTFRFDSNTGNYIFVSRTIN